MAKRSLIKSTTISPGNIYYVNIFSHKATSKFSVLDFLITDLKLHYSILQKTSVLLSTHSPMAHRWMSQITLKFFISHISQKMEFYIYTALTFRVTTATNATSDSIATKPLPLPFLILPLLFLIFYHLEGSIYPCATKAVEIQNIMEEDQWKAIQNHPKRRENILNISVTVFKESNENLSRSEKNIILKRQKKSWRSIWAIT